MSACDYICAACGAIVPLQTDSLDSGTVLRCAKCDGETVVDLDTPGKRAERYEAAAEYKAAAPVLAMVRGGGLPIDLEPSPDDPAKLVTRHPLLAGLSIELGRLLKETPGADNFVVFDIEPKGSPGFSVAVQRMGGKSPSVLLGELRADVDAARSREARLREALEWMRHYAEERRRHAAEGSGWEGGGGVANYSTREAFERIDAALALAPLPAGTPPTPP